MSGVYTTVYSLILNPYKGKIGNHVVEGLVNVHTIQVTTDYAFTALIDKLTGIAGVSVTTIDWSGGSVTCMYASDVIPQVSTALTQVLVNDWLFERIVRDFEEQYQVLTHDELEYLILVFLHEIRSGELRVAGRIYDSWLKRIERGLLVLLSLEGETVSLDGFVRFRMRTFISAFTALAAERLEQFMLDKEYEESVSMLRFILDGQPPSQDELNVFCAPDRVWITDSNGGLLRDSDVTDAALAESNGDLNSEDLAMSILITRSPCKIVLHDIDHQAVWPSFAQTILRVFGERVQMCGHCSTCKQLERSCQYLPLEVDHPRDHDHGTWRNP